MVWGSHLETRAMTLGTQQVLCLQHTALNVLHVLCWADARLDEADKAVLRPFALKVDSHMTSHTFAKLPFAFLQDNVPTLDMVMSTLHACPPISRFSHISRAPHKLLSHVTSPVTRNFRITGFRSIA